MNCRVNKDNKKAQADIEVLLIGQKVLYEKLESITFPGHVVYDIVGGDPLLALDCMKAGASSFSK